MLRVPEFKVEGLGVSRAYEETLTNGNPEAGNPKHIVGT